MIVSNTPTSKNEPPSPHKKKAEVSRNDFLDPGGLIGGSVIERGEKEKKKKKTTKSCFIDGCSHVLKKLGDSYEA